MSTLPVAAVTAREATQKSATEQIREQSFFAQQGNHGRTNKLLAAFLVPLLTTSSLIFRGETVEGNAPLRLPEK